MVKTVIFSKAWNDEVFEYSMKVSELLEETDATALGLTQASGVLTDANALMADAQRHVRSSLITEQVRAASELSKDSYRALRDYALVYTLSTKPEEREAANSLVNLVAAYGVRAYKLSYTVFSSRVRNLLNDIDSSESYQAAVATIGAGAWVDQLRAAHESFGQLYTARLRENASKRPDTKSDEGRAAILDALQKLYLFLDFQVNYGDSAAYTALVNDMNELTQAINTSIRQRIAQSSDNGGGEPENDAEEGELETEPSSSTA